MPLFPGVKNCEDDLSTESIKDASTKWLQNSSFKAELVNIEQTREETKETPTLAESIQDQLKDLREAVNIKKQASEDSDVERADSKPEEDVHRGHKLKKRKSKHSKKYEHDKKKKRRNERSPSRSPPRIPPPPRKVFLEELRNLGYKDAYRIDRKCDKDNYAFQALNKKHVSTYRTYFKIPLGLTRIESRSWRKNTARNGGAIRYHSKSVHKDIYNPGSAVQSTSDAGVSDSLPQIIEVSSLPQTVVGKKSSENPLGILDESTVLWTQGKAPDSVHKADDSSSYLSSSVAQKMAAYNRDLRDNPSNITLWLDLVNIQDGLLQQRTEDDSAKLFTEQNIHDKKIAIVNQALKKNPSNLQLKLKHLELSGKTLDWSDVSEEWRKLTFTHINCIEVWRGYLNHVKNSFTKFTVGMMMKAYTKCLKSLRQVSQGLLKSHQCQPHTVESMIDILLELCDLLHLANCTEKAVAIIQAMIEFNLCRPPSLNTHQAAVQLFQEFYDSGVPRFGEPGAKGWCNVKPNEYTVIPAPLKPTAEQDEEEEETILASCKDKTKAETWFKLEQTRQTSHWLPWRPSANESETDCEDPHRLVLSDDFIDVLFYIEDEELRNRAYFDFLHWFGMRYQGGHFIHHQMLSGVNQLNKPLSGGCHKYEWQEYILSNLFIAHCTEQIVQHWSGEDKSKLIMIKLYHQFNQVKTITDKKERKKRSKEFKHFAKSILSLEENRNNQKLWLCYAECNRDLELYSDMSQVYNVLLSAQGESTADDDLLTSTRCDLWWQAILGETTHPQPSQERILSVCCWLVCGGGGAVSSSPSSSQKLLLLRKLESHIQTYWEKVQGYSSSETNQKESLVVVFSHLVVCHYICLGQLNGVAALEQSVYHWTPQLRELLMCEKNHTLTDYYIRLIAILKYTQKHLYQSSTPLLRSILQNAISDVPESTVLLQDYLGLERVGHVTTRVRQFFTSSLSTTGDIAQSGRTREILAAHSVLFELERLEALSLCDDKDRGINHRVRSLCEKCLNTVCPTSVLLWRLYMYHEAIYGSKQKTESIFYAAIQACPYAKCLYTDAIQFLPHKLVEILDIAEDKEIRIHTPLGELDILLHQE